MQSSSQRDQTDANREVPRHEARPGLLRTIGDVVSNFEHARAAGPPRVKGRIKARGVSAVAVDVGGRSPRSVLAFGSDRTPVGTVRKCEDGLNEPVQFILWEGTEVFGVLSAKSIRDLSRAPASEV